MKNNRLFAFFFRVAAALFSIFMVLTTTGIFKGHLSFTSFLFYTTLSNAIVAVMFFVLATKTLLEIKKSGKTGSCSFYPRISACATVTITVTLIVFWSILVWFLEPKIAMKFESFGQHLIVPFLMIFDYFFFTERGKLKKYDPLFFLVIPFAYMVLVTIVAFGGFVYPIMEPGRTSGRRFPYFFLDFFELGFVAAIYVVGIMAFFLALNYLLYWFDKKKTANNSYNFK
jgi:hypothetical protein